MNGCLKSVHFQLYLGYCMAQNFCELMILTFAGRNFQKFGFQILLLGTIFADLRQVSEKNISHSAPVHTKN